MPNPSATAIPEASTPRCAYCASAALAPWLDGVTDRLGHAPGSWSFWQCKECRSALLQPTPTPEQLTAFYPEVYSFHGDVAKKRPFALVARLEERFFFRLQYRAQIRTFEEVIGKPFPGARLLDVGCGVGQRLQLFRRLGYTVHGLDFLPAVVEYLRGSLGIDATCGDLQDLDRLFPEQSFDVVTASQVVEHVHDARALLRSCHRVLRRSGWFVAMIPMGDSVQANVLGSRWSSAREAPRHLNLPSRKGLEAACRAAGFSRVELRPDTLLNCAALIGLSVIPSAATTNVYGKSSARAMGLRAVAAAVTLASAPAVYLENNLLRRPATAILFAQR